MSNRFFPILALAVLVTFASARVAPAQTTAPNPPVPAQTAQPAPLTPKALEMRQKVEKIGIGGRITVVRFDGIEHYGTIRNLAFGSVEVAEVDIKQNVVDSYNDVKKVRKGYGGLNYVSGKRPNPVLGWVIGAAIFVPLFIALSQLD